MSNPHQTEKFLCRPCNRMGRHEFRFICRQCWEDYMRVVELYNSILRERPDLSTLTIPELLTRLREAVKKRTGA